MAKTIKLGTADLLRQCLAATGWAKTALDIYNAGKLLATKLGDFPKDADDAWRNLPYDFDFSPAETETARKAAKHFIEAGAFPVSAFSVELIETLDLLR